MSLIARLLHGGVHNLHAQRRGLAGRIGVRRFVQEAFFQSKSSAEGSFEQRLPLNRNRLELETCHVAKPLITQAPHIRHQWLGWVRSLYAGLGTTHIRTPPPTFQQHHAQMPTITENVWGVPVFRSGAFDLKGWGYPEFLGAQRRHVHDGLFDLIPGTRKHRINLSGSMRSHPAPHRALMRTPD